jgi:hypothetical protein
METVTLTENFENGNGVFKNGKMNGSNGTNGTKGKLRRDKNDSFCSNSSRSPSPTFSQCGEK